MLNINIIQPKVVAIHNLHNIGHSKSNSLSVGNKCPNKIIYSMVILSVLA